MPIHLSRSRSLSISFCLGLLLALSKPTQAQTADQAATITKVVAFLRNAHDSKLADRIAGDFKNGKLDFDTAVNADDRATSAWYNPQTGRISINPSKTDEVLAKSLGTGSNYGTISLAATLKHEYIHEGQPSSMHQSSALNETSQTRAKETPAYDAALKGYQAWADSILNDLSMAELWPDGTQKAKKIEELGFTLKNLKGSYQDYLVGIRENRNSGNLDPNFEWTGINGVKGSDPDQLDDGGRLDYGIKKAAELVKNIRHPDAGQEGPPQTKDAEKPAGEAGKKSQKHPAAQPADAAATDADAASRDRVIAALSGRGLSAPDALVSRLAGILDRQGEGALKSALDGLASMQGTFKGSGFTLAVKDFAVSGSFHERKEYTLPNATVSVTVTDGKPTGWVDPASGAISLDVLFVTNTDGQVEQVSQKLVGEFTGRGYQGHIVGQEDANWQVGVDADR